MHTVSHSLKAEKWVPRMGLEYKIYSIYLCVAWGGPTCKIEWSHMSEPVKLEFWSSLGLKASVDRDQLPMKKSKYLIYVGEVYLML